MRKNLIKLCASFILLLCFTGCNSLKAVSEKSLNIKLSELLDSEYKIIIYEERSDILAKDDEADPIYVIGNHEISYYGFDSEYPESSLSMGEYSKMTDAEIVDYLEGLDYEKYNMYVEQHEKDYVIVLNTDSTGNHVESEAIYYKYIDKDGEENVERFLKFFASPISFSEIYENTYIGLYYGTEIDYMDDDDIEYVYWYKNSIDNKQFELQMDGLDCENALIDPSYEDICKALNVEYEEKWKQ